MPNTILSDVEHDDDMSIPPLEPDELDEPEAEEPDEDEKPPREPEVKQVATAQQKRTRTTARKRSKAAREQQKQTREMTVEEWLTWCDGKWGWDRPGVNCYLEREYPRQINGVPSAGRVATRSGGHFSVDEVQELYGGGEYTMSISVPAEQYGKAPTISRKRFSVSGSPKLSAVQVDAAQADAITSGNGGGIGMAPDKNFYGMLDKQLERNERLWRDRVKSDGNVSPADIRAPYEQSMKAITEAAERGANERIRAAEQLAADKEAKANEAREEVRRVKLEMRDFEEQQRLKVQEAVTRSSDLLGALLPTFSENAARQVDQITRTFEAREARIEEGHSREMQQQMQMHQAQLQQIAQTHQAEMARAEATWTAQRGLLEQQLQHAHMELMALREESKRLRDEQLALRVSQFESLQKERDPMTKLGELAQLREAVGDLGFGGGGGGEGEGDLGDAPAWMKLFNNVVNSAAPVVQAAFGQREQAGPGGPLAGPPAGPRALVPQGQQQLTPEQAQAIAQTRAAQAAQAQAQARKTRVAKKDVRALMATVGQAFLAKTPAERVVEIAAKHPDVDTELLRVLTRKEPDRVLAELDNAELIPDQLRSTEGRAYLTAMLKVLPNHI
jgi:hypothetical protein